MVQSEGMSIADAVNERIGVTKEHFDPWCHKVTQQTMKKRRLEDFWNEQDAVHCAPPVQPE